jgi:hypothetical protein
LIRLCQYVHSLVHSVSFPVVLQQFHVCRHYIFLAENVIVHRRDRKDR